MQDAGDQSYMVTEIKESGLSSRHSCSFLCHPFHFGFSPIFLGGCLIGSFVGTLSNVRRYDCSNHGCPHNQTQHVSISCSQRSIPPYSGVWGENTKCNVHRLMLARIIRCRAYSSCRPLVRIAQCQGKVAHPGKKVVGVLSCLFFLVTSKNTQCLLTAYSRRAHTSLSRAYNEE